LLFAFVVDPLAAPADDVSAPDAPAALSLELPPPCVAHSATNASAMTVTAVAMTTLVRRATPEELLLPGPGAGSSTGPSTGSSNG